MNSVKGSYRRDLRRHPSPVPPPLDWKRPLPLVACPGKMRLALSFLSGGRLFRRHYDLHDLTGLAGALLLIPLALTGFNLEFPDVVTSVMRWCSPVRDQPPGLQPRSTPQAGVPGIPSEQALARSETVFPDSKPMWFGFLSMTGTVTQSGFVNRGRFVRHEGKAKSGSINTAEPSYAYRIGEHYERRNLCRRALSPPQR